MCKLSVKLLALLRSASGFTLAYFYVLVLQWYTGGISHPQKSDCNRKVLNHAVLLVGYGQGRCMNNYRVYKYEHSMSTN